MVQGHREHFSLHGITDERNRFELALESLDLRHMQKIRHVLQGLHCESPYTQLKQALSQAYSVSRRKQPSKHCIVGPMLARCSCQHLLTSAQRCSQCWGDAVLHQSPAFSQHWHSAAGRHRNLRQPNNGGIMFPTSARSWQTAANQHRNCS